ncbi:uncharacterized protein LOC105188220 isoform X2 [Harpegnathos saltator]|uniref:uncharacterized protein LOC105188220 isoform X2 n=1 Tax=Harpegnathos saltator TaxID=610380 RepID=UPI000DBEEC45|nr:uncharacterized protein LOC105188220 isoform X2 [Harpegnathos saltator]
MRNSIARNFDFIYCVTLRRKLFHLIAILIKRYGSASRQVITYTAGIYFSNGKKEKCLWNKLVFLLRSYEIVDMCDVRLTPIDGKSDERSANEVNAHLNNSDVHTRIRISRGCLIIGEYKDVCTSTVEHENHHLLATATEEMELKKNKRLEETTFNSFDGKKLINTTEEKARSENTHIEAFEFKKTIEESKGRKRVFSLFDTLIALVVIGPSTVGFWRGIWTWMDLHRDLFPAWFCFMTGATLHVLFAFFKDRFHIRYMDEWTKLNTFKRLPYRALQILYTYTFGVACNAHWRGCWIIIDDYFFMHLCVEASFPRC